MVAPRLYEGKYKYQIAQEAFAKLGINATRKQINAYFKKYGVETDCAESMYYGIKNKAKLAGRPSKTAYVAPKRKVGVKIAAKVSAVVPPQRSEPSVFGVLSNARKLIDELGSKEDAKRLIDLL